MCGIIAVVGSNEAAPLLLEGLKLLEYRGYDSAGIATVKELENSKKGTLSCKKAEGKVSNLERLLNKEAAEGYLGIAHTRWATHGKPEYRNAHPHIDTFAEVAVVQNGIIENHRDLREELKLEGIKFASETDTEVIPHLISRELALGIAEGLPQTNATFLAAVQRTLLLLDGSYAIAVVWLKAPSTLVVAKRQAPLIIGFGQGEFLCASDTHALAGFTRTVLPMQDDEVALLSPLGIELYDSKGNRQHRNPSLLTGGDYIPEKRDFRHFMLKEIHEQPAIAEVWVSKYLPLGSQKECPISLPLEESFLDNIDQIHILACGTSRHAAMVGAYLLEQYAGISTSVFYASEFRYSPPPLTPNTLTIGVSQSGETADTLAALEMDRKRRDLIDDPSFATHQLGITNRTNSSLARQVEHIIDVGAGIEIGVAATKTFLGQLLTFYALTIAFASKRKSLSSKELNQLVRELRELPELLKGLILKHEKLSQSLAHNFSNTKDVLFISRGINYPIALEGALKLKEISYIHAQGYPAGELKHGPIALLDQNVPVVSVAVPGIVFEKVLSNSQEAKARDSLLIGVAPAGADSEIFDYLFDIPVVSEFLSPLLTMIPLQLFSYHIAAHKGLDVDQPRNLAKSVTVE